MSGRGIAGLFKWAALGIVALASCHGKKTVDAPDLIDTAYARADSLYSNVYFTMMDRDPKTPDKVDTFYFEAKKVKDKDRKEWVPGRVYKTLYDTTATGLRADQISSFTYKNGDVLRLQFCSAAEGLKYNAKLVELALAMQEQRALTSKEHKKDTLVSVKDGYATFYLQSVDPRVQVY